MSKKVYHVTEINIMGFKRIDLARITIDNAGNVVTIGGENGNGKSSVLDALQMALGRPKNASDFVRKTLHDGPGLDGEDLPPAMVAAPQTAVKVTVSEVEGDKSTPRFDVIRTVEGGSAKLQVIDKSFGQFIKSPADLLKTIFNETMVDPKEFLDADPRDRRKTMMQIAGVDPSEIDAAIKEHREELKSLETRQTELKGIADEQPHYPDAPKELASVDALANQLADARTHNGKLNALKNKEYLLRQSVESAEKRIAELKEMLKAAQEEREQLAKERADAKVEIDSFEEIDTSKIEGQLAGIEEANQKVRANQTRERCIANWKDAEKKLGETLEAIRALERTKRDMLAKAQFPVEGLGFDDTDATFEGLPVSTWSTAQALRIATAIRLALSPDFPLVIIRDGNDIDNKTLAQIAEEAEKYNAQVLVERVANETEDGWDRSCTFYMKDGALVQGGAA